MSYYVQYVEPVIGNIKPMLEKETKLLNVKKLQKMVADIKKPLFEIHTKKYKTQKIYELYNELYMMYKDMVFVLNAWYPNVNKQVEEFLYIHPKEGKSKKKATASLLLQDQFDKEHEIPKKYRGILGTKNYNDSIMINKSTMSNNAMRFWVVPERNMKEKSFNAVVKFGESIAAKKCDIGMLRNQLEELAKMTKYHDATDKKNKRRRGALGIEKEFAKEIKDTNKILRVSKELKKRTDHYKNEELRMFQEIKKQETVVDDLKTSSQAKMESVVKAGKKAEFASFKNAQEEINKLIEEQEKLMALKDYLKRVKLNKASVKKRLVVSVKQDLMQNYYRKEK